ncbi:hypothetical protein GCM10022378_11210 [Salinicoccus jeotgali]|uniref:Uncharacterized protein n=1 Tax=Salinicoccus jeotgali TaxID=381634 RepID=A0ABP7EQT7_9STAP
MKFQEMFGVRKQEQAMEEYNLTVADLDKGIMAVLEAFKERNDELVRHLKMNDRREERRHELNKEEFGKVRKDIETVDEKHSKKYAEPWEVDAIKNAVSDKAELFVRRNGVQLTLDAITPVGHMTLEEITIKRNAAEKQFRKDLRAVKSKILVSTKKYLGMKGNARNDHIRSVDVDRATRYIKSLTAKDIQI